MHHFLAMGACVAVMFISLSAGAAITVQIDKDRLPMGRDIRVEARVTDDAGKPVAGALLLPYVNQRRWGAHEKTDAAGAAVFTFPLPNPGPAEVRVLMRTQQGEPNSYWIWVGAPKDGQSVYLARKIAIDKPVENATLYAAVDDQCEIFLNGEKIGDTAGWRKPLVISDLAAKLKQGENAFAVGAKNGTGPAGVLARLEVQCGGQMVVTESDASWQGWTEQPAGWPVPSTPGEPVTVVGRVDKTTWSPALKGWPSLVDADELFTGRLMPDPLPHGAAVSNKVTVEVSRRAIAAHKPSDRLVGMQWEPWFTPLNAFWQTAQAVPVFGFYDSYNRDVLRQHILWFADLGVDFIMPDWSNHIWGKKHWNERPEGTNEIIHATGLLLESLADMKAEGIPVPKVVLMPGLSNGEPCTMTAMNEQLEWVYDAWVKNPRFNGLWLDFDGKPLIVILDCGVVAGKDSVPVDETHWTVRWMSTQLQKSHHEKLGYWSWMDGSLRPVVTYRDGAPEVVTPTPSYFGDGGWLYPEARGRRGGSTYLESFKAAMETHPRVVLLHQWNEYAGQPEGQGYGAKHDIYVDSYNVELSDDLEPVSLTATAYRNDTGGWGYYYLNLTQALLAMYRGDAPDDTLVAIAKPLANEKVADDSSTVEWSVFGKEPASCTISVDDKVIAGNVSGNSYKLELKDIASGTHTIVVTANGATTHYPLSLTDMDLPLEKAVPTRAEVKFAMRK